MADTQNTGEAPMMAGNVADVNALLISNVRQEFTAAFEPTYEGGPRKASGGWFENGCTEQHPTAEHYDVLRNSGHLGRFQPDKDSSFD